MKFPQEWWGLDGKVHPSELTYVGTLLYHDPCAIVSVPFQETWTEIEKLCDKGLAKNIGMR